MKLQKNAKDNKIGKLLNSVTVVRSISQSGYTTVKDLI